MRIIRSILGYCALALAGCMGYIGLSFAEPIMVSASYLLSSVGSYGEAKSKYHAELASMAVQSDGRLQRSNSLTTESNGFRLASMTQRGVAQGTMGSMAVGLTL